MVFVCTAWTCGMICWFSSWRAFVHSDGHFWMCSAQDGPVASCLRLNGPKWPCVPQLALWVTRLFVAALSPAINEGFHTVCWKNKIATCCLLQLGDAVIDIKHTTQWQWLILVQCSDYKSICLLGRSNLKLCLISGSSSWKRHRVCRLNQHFLPNLDSLTLE